MDSGIKRYDPDDELDHYECDDDERCEIIAASFRGEAVEWRKMPDGEIKCISFVPKGEPIPVPRCEHTAELFGAVQDK